MEYAGVAVRFVAVLIDTIVLFVLIMVIGLLAGGWYSTTENGAHQVGVNAGGWWTLLVLLGYYIGSEALTGKTIGKHAVGLRVVDQSGAAIGLGQAIGRNLLRPVDAFFVYFVAAIAVWTSPKAQRIGDRAAGTVVVEDHGEWLESAWSRPPAYEPPEPRVDDSRVYTEERFREDMARAKRVGEQRPSES